MIPASGTIHPPVSITNQQTNPSHKMHFSATAYLVITVDLNLPGYTKPIDIGIYSEPTPTLIWKKGQQLKQIVLAEHSDPECLNKAIEVLKKNYISLIEQLE